MISDCIASFTDADGEAVQPYFAAFMLAKGYQRAKHIFERDGHGLEYFEWIAARWADFEADTGSTVYPRSSRAAEFTQWLSRPRDLHSVDTLSLQRRSSDLFYPPVGMVAVMRCGTRIEVWDNESDADCFTGLLLPGAGSVTDLSCLWARDQIDHIETPTEADRPHLSGLYHDGGCSP